MSADQPIAEGSYAQLHAEVTRLRTALQDAESWRAEAEDEAKQLRAELTQRAEQAEELLRVAHDTSNRSEAERARAVRRAERAEAEAERQRDELAAYETHAENTSRILAAKNEALAQAEAERDTAQAELAAARRVLTALPDPSTVEELREKVTEILGDPSEATVHAFLDFAWSETARIAGKEMAARWQAEDELAEMRAAIERITAQQVRAEHFACRPDRCGEEASGMDGKERCHGCRRVWPCPTLAALTPPSAPETRPVSVESPGNDGFRYEPAEQAPANVEGEPEPGTYWERAVLERFVTGGPVDMQTVRQQVAVLLAETPRRRPSSPESTEETDHG